MFLTFEPYQPYQFFKFPISMKSSNPTAITVAEMRAIEHDAQVGGISALQMMQTAGHNAAQALADYLREHWPPDRPARILFLCGPGNNGGDGLVCAAALFDLTTRGQFGNGAIGALTLQIYLLRARKEDDPVFQPVRVRGIFVADAESDLRWRVFLQLIGHANIVVDAVLGIGTSRPIGSHLKEMLDEVRRVRQLKREEGGPLLIALDGVSGMNYDTGELDPNSVAADVTITFHAPKHGHFRSPAKEASGALLVAGIGV